MLVTVDNQETAKKVFSSLIQGVSQHKVFRVSYAEVDENGFTKEEQQELLEIVSDVKQGKNLSPAFTSTEELFAYLDSDNSNDED